MKEKPTKFIIQEAFKSEDIDKRKETLEKIFIKIIKDEELNAKV